MKFLNKEYFDSAIGMEQYFPWFVHILPPSLVMRRQWTFSKESVCVSQLLEWSSISPDSLFERPPHPLSPSPGWIRFSPSPGWIRFHQDCCHEQFPTTSQTCLQFWNMKKFSIVIWFLLQIKLLHLPPDLSMQTQFTAFSPQCPL